MDAAMHGTRSRSVRHGWTRCAARAPAAAAALLVHAHPAYRADFHRLYAPFAADIGFARLLLG